jgi:ribosomal protein S18 acetylase RimI-like enzyme
MDARSAGDDDLPALVELQRRSDVAWFGVPEQGEDEVRETWDRIERKAEDSRLVWAGDRLVAAAWRWGVASDLVLDPDIDPSEVYDDLLGWFAAGPPVVIEALHQDERRRAALTARGWEHTRSGFDLLRPVTGDWVLADPVWAAGVELRDYRPEHARAVHHLVYVDAAFADVPGHHRRDFDEWFGLFLAEHARPEPPVVLWRGERIIGVSLGRLFSDGAGWLSQLAVATDERGQGFGKALLLETLHRRVAAGASTLGLGVMAHNRGALGLYVDVGLRIDREWLAFERASSPSAATR